jgi:hypothetical protein
MIDTATVIRDYLLADTALVALVGERIWAERVVPPPGYTPSVGPSIVFRTRGGQVLAQGSVVAPSVQFKCYGGASGSAPAELNANAVYRALYDAIERDGGGHGVKSCTVEVLGQTLSEPDTGWIFVLTFASFWMNADA